MWPEGVGIFWIELYRLVVVGDSAVMVALRVCPETSVRITKFSEHEPD
jgi:hypothetical protein